MNSNTNNQSKWDSVKRYKLTKMLNELSNISGHGTELVTVYIPPRRPIFDIISQLRNEAGTASNIKSDLTRTHVQDALSNPLKMVLSFSVELFQLAKVSVQKKLNSILLFHLNPFKSIFIDVMIISG
jgi:hypothetical protein